MSPNGPLPQDPGPLPAPEHKSEYVQHMFSRIARRYDLMNRLMTLGRDRAWRRITVALAASGERPQLRILDVATGTGDLALEALRQEPESLVVGIDFVPEMLALAQQKSSEQAPSSTPTLRRNCPNFAVGDALRLPFPNGYFDAIVTGFALRNVTGIPAAFSEMARVTRRGGRVACLEIAKPKLPLFRRLFALYFYRIVPLIGGLVTGQRSAYTYLPHSLSAFLTPDEIVEVMQNTGWSDVRYRRLMFGTVAVHQGTRD